MNKGSKRKPGKLVILIVCLDLIALLVVGGTLAYIFTSSDPVTNTFIPVTSHITITEKFNDSVKSNVAVKNTGEVDSYIRAKVIVTWQNESGQVYPVSPVEGTHYTIVNGSDWTKAADGLWYYKTSVAPGKATGSEENEEGYLIKEARWIKECDDTSFALHIEILSQAIQATPAEAVDKWDSDDVDLTGGSTVDANGNYTLTVENKVTGQSQ